MRIQAYILSTSDFKLLMVEKLKKIGVSTASYDIQHPIRRLYLYDLRRTATYP